MRRKRRNISEICRICFFLPGLQLYAFLPIFRPPFAVEIEAIRLVKKTKGASFSLSLPFSFLHANFASKGRREREKEESEEGKRKARDPQWSIFSQFIPLLFLWGKSTKIYKKGGNGGEGERGRREDLFVQFAKGKGKERDLNSPTKKGKKRRRGRGARYEFKLQPRWRKRPCKRVFEPPDVSARSLSKKNRF